MALVTALLLAFTALMTLNAGAATLSPTHHHGLLVRDDGTLAAWGHNSAGQLDDGTYIDRSFPVAVSGLNGVKVAAGGYLHSIALKTDGTVWAWGSNTFGGSGPSRPATRRSP